MQYLGSSRCRTIKGTVALVQQYMASQLFHDWCNESTFVRFHGVTNGDNLRIQVLWHVVLCYQLKRS